MAYLYRFLTFCSVFLFIITGLTMSQDNEMDPGETEAWSPVPPVITPGQGMQPPSDAIVLFDGSDLSKWQQDGQAAQWIVENGFMTVKAGTGSIETKQGFGSVQLHVEWRAPKPARGEGQDRGNSGIFLHNRYEVQVLDSYKNKTYSNGMAGSIYKQYIPGVNASRKPGEWQSYDIIFIAPEFNSDGSLESPARMTVFWNGILVHHDVELKGPTVYIGHPEYEAYDPVAPISLQDHDHPVSYRNIWLREID